MLGLLVSTNSGWVAAANANLPTLLIDHAHCEKKAAAMAMSLVNRYSDFMELVDRLVALAQEELEHFARIHGVLKSRSITLTRDRGDAYARRLQEHLRTQEPQRMLDALLIAALIEARSCERFTILSKECVDGELRELYAALLASEAGHHALFTELARMRFPAREVKARLHELAVAEADIVASLPNDAAMHG